MPFENTLFQPELIDAMHAAFIVACARMRLRPGSRESDPVASRIVDLAKVGATRVGSPSWFGSVGIERSRSRARRAKGSVAYLSHALVLSAFDEASRTRCAA